MLPKMYFNREPDCYLPPQPKRITRIIDDRDRLLAVQQYFTNRKFRTPIAEVVVRQIHFSEKFHHDDITFGMQTHRYYRGSEKFINVDVEILVLYRPDYNAKTIIGERLQRIMSSYFNVPGYYRVEVDAFMHQYDYCYDRTRRFEL